MYEADNRSLHVVNAVSPGVQLRVAAGRPLEHAEEREKVRERLLREYPESEAAG